jgi:hypothetical protein
MTNIKRAQHLSWRQLGEHTIILDSRINQEVHHLNDIGAFLWELCDGSNSIDQICDSLTREYDTDLETAQRDVQEFVSKLKSKSLLEEGHE